MPVETVQIKSSVYRYNNGGLNVRQPVNMIADNEASIAVNTVSFENGSVFQRPPWTRWGNAVPIASGNWLTGVSGVNFNGIASYVVATDQSKIFASRTDVPNNTWNDVTGTLTLTRATQAVNGGTGKAIVSFVQMGAYLIGYDGTNAPWKFDGTLTAGVPNAATLLNASPPVGYVAPPIGSAAIQFQDRLCWVGVSGSPSRLFYSELNDPTLYTLSDYVDIPSQTDNDYLVGFGVLYGNLMVFKRNSIYLIQGTDPTNWVVTRLNSSVGALSPSAILPVDNLIYFMSDKGLYGANPYNVIFMSPKVEPVYAKSTSLNFSAVNNAVSYILANCKFLSSVLCAYGEGRGTIGLSAARDTIMAHDYFNVDQSGYPTASKFMLGSLPGGGTSLNLPGPACMSEALTPVFSYPTVVASFGDASVYYLNKPTWLTKASGASIDDYGSTVSPTVINAVNSAGGSSYNVGVTDLGALTLTPLSPNVASPASIILAAPNGQKYTLGAADPGVFTTLATNIAATAVLTLVSPLGNQFTLGVTNNGVLTTTQVVGSAQNPLLGTAIEMIYATKSFDFGDPDALKQIRWIWTEGQGSSPTLTLLYSNNPTLGETSSAVSFAVGSRQAPPSHAPAKYHRFKFYSIGGTAVSIPIYLTQMSFDVIMKGRRY